MERCFADMEEDAATLEAFAAEATGDDLLRAYDLLQDLYDATDDPERKLLRGWVRGGSIHWPDDPGTVGARRTPNGMVEYLRRENDDDRRRRLAYNAYMSMADAEWTHACAALEEATGLQWSMWQTGGMCLALGAYLTPGSQDPPFAMLTDYNGPLSPRRGLHDPDGYENIPLSERGWFLGVYRDNDMTEPDYFELGGDVTYEPLDKAMAATVAGKIKEALHGSSD